MATQEFCLDLAFCSTASAVQTNSPIRAVGHGWAANVNGQWVKTTHTVNPGAMVGLNVYDGSAAAATNNPPIVTGITVTPKTGSPVFFPTQPNTDPTDLGPGAPSAGTNMVGRAWFFGSFPLPPATQSGTIYDFIVTITMKDGTQFEIDPRMIVGTTNFQPDDYAR